MPPLRYSHWRYAVSTNSSQAHTALKYGFAKTRIQRALSHDPSHIRREDASINRKGNARLNQNLKKEKKSTPAKQAKVANPHSGSSFTTH